MGQSPVGTSYNKDGSGEPLINGPTEFTDRHPEPKQWTTAPVRFCQSGDVLICVRGSSTGRTNVADRVYCIGRGVAAVRASKGNDQQFVQHALAAVVADLLQLQTGSTFPSIDSRVIRNAAVLIPELGEQRQIGAALCNADKAIESLDALIAKKRDVKQATMQQLLTGRTRLPGFAADWKEVRLGECLTIMHGKNQSQIVDPEGRYPILATGGVIGRTNSYLSNKPSVLIGRKGTIDRPQYMDTPFWTVDTLFYSEVKNANSAKFLFYKFLMVNWKKYNEASGVPSLNASTIENVEMMMPPLKEQEAIAEVLTVMDEELEALKQQVSKLRMVKEGMMQDLLTGKVRLV